MHLWCKRSISLSVAVSCVIFQFAGSNPAASGSAYQVAEASWLPFLKSAGVEAEGHITVGIKKPASNNWILELIFCQMIGHSESENQIRFFNRLTAF